MKIITKTDHDSYIIELSREEFEKLTTENRIHEDDIDEFLKNMKLYFAPKLNKDIPDWRLYNALRQRYNGGWREMILDIKSDFAPLGAKTKTLALKIIEKNGL